MTTLLQKLIDLGWEAVDELAAHEDPEHANYLRAKWTDMLEVAEGACDGEG